MKNLTSIALATLTANLLVGCVTGDNEMPDDQDSTAKIEFPKTCAERAQGEAKLADGEYELFLANQEDYAWKAFCVDMSTKSPKEYLTLPKADQTYSRYSAGGVSPGTDVETKFDKIRIDPITLKVDMADLTFAVSTGSLSHNGTTPITSLPLGVALVCEDAANAFGQIDLRDTPFGIVDRFKNQGLANGGSNMWENGQVVELHVNGLPGSECGWIGPATVGYDAPVGMTSNWGFAVTYL